MAHLVAAAFISVLLLVGPLAASAACSYSGPFSWTGASSLTANLTSQIQSFVNSNYGTSIPAYVTANSPAAVACINSCTCGLGFSDQPMDATQNAVFGTGKITVPSFVQTYNFFTSGNTGKKPVKLTGKTSYNIFKSPGQTWGSYLTPGLGQPAFSKTQKILRAARTAQSAQYALCQQYWIKSKSGYSGPQDGSPFPASWGLDFLGKSTLAIGQYIAANKGAIGFGSVSLLKSVSGTVQANLKNKAGIFQNDNRWDLNSAIPRPLPPPTASWAAVSLVFNAGPQTPPAASFTYGLARLSGNGDVVATAAKAVLNGLQNKKFAKTLTDNFVFPVPSTLSNRWASYISKISA